MKLLLAGLAVLLAVATCTAGADDLIIADFENESLAGWQRSTDEFAAASVREPLEDHRPIYNYRGQGFLTTCLPTNMATGTLSSPPFTIERSHINFLLGGGREWRQLALQLVIGGKVVRKATPKHWTESLVQDSWDVSEFAGKQASIRIVDNLAGRWGYLTVDQIVQSNISLKPITAQRELLINSNKLYLPINAHGSVHQVKILADGKPIRLFDAAIASSADETSLTTYTDVSDFKGQTLTLVAGPTQQPKQKLSLVSQGDAMPEADELYQEPTRPGFHFTTAIGWLNDPNGLVYYDDQWHLFYQHNPYATHWANMHWGHAVSDDLFHWREVGVALYAKTQLVGQAYSGSAFIDSNNTAGYQTGNKPPLMIALTDTGGRRGERIAYSNHAGRSFVFPNNEYDLVHPITGRDPKIIWHEPTKKWIMAVYEVTAKATAELPEQEAITFHSSPNLKQWTRESSIHPFHECPDLFELPIDGDMTKTKWVVHGADAQYLLGDFDGHRFTPDQEAKRPLWFGDCSAGQSFSNAPNDRRVQLLWGRVDFGDARFNQQMTVPVELSLRTTNREVRLHANPVKEIETLRIHSINKEAFAITGTKSLAEVTSEFLDIEVRFHLGTANSVGLIVRGKRVEYDVKRQTILIDGRVPTVINHTATPTLQPVNNQVKLRLLIDRGSLEVFANDGQLAIHHAHLFDANNLGLTIFAEGGEAEAGALRISTLESTK